MNKNSLGVAGMKDINDKLNCHIKGLIAVITKPMANFEDAVPGC
jgi:hypothetical protein